MFKEILSDLAEILCESWQKKTLSTMRYASWLSRFLTILHIDIKTPLKLIPQASKWSIKTFKSFPSHRWDYLHFKSLSKQQVVPKTLQSANVSSSAILRKQKDNNKKLSTKSQFPLTDFRSQNLFVQKDTRKLVNGHNRKNTQSPKHTKNFSEAHFTQTRTKSISTTQNNK